ncbi:MAG: glycoside hydrolase family 88 protein [Bacteroidota bacterium]|nr:glycoside hydrolase family 88 protein [Bacteroidota bacterium]
MDKVRMQTVKLGIGVCLFLLSINTGVLAQHKLTDGSAPLHTLQPDYPVPYTIPTITAITKKLDEVYNYLNAVTPFQLINKQSGQEVALADVDTNTVFKKGEFRLTSYEWGVTYAGMLAAGIVTGDKKFTNYSKKRLEFMADALPYLKKVYQQYPSGSNPLKSVIDPQALDDAGAMCAAIIKTLQEGGRQNLKILSDNFIHYISEKQYRLSDGTLARERPQHNTLWLDDLFMSVPALAQQGKLTGESKYFNDAVQQMLQFSERMFNKEKNIYMHGWSESMNEHPQFHWARANGWAIMAMVELLDVLPETHPLKTKIIHQLQLHVKGLASYQSDKGFWHQLLDRNDSYLETSATAIYCYAIAKAINHQWIDAKAYAPMCVLAWNAVSTKINQDGQVEGTCVGTGMGFEPAFYYHRPVSVYAAHGYGPVLLAGAEMIQLLQKHKFSLNDMALQLIN